jgi:hypothetical protein
LDQWSLVVLIWLLPGNLPRIGIVAHTWRADGARPLIILNIGAGPRREDRPLRYRITGHYRYRPDAAVGRRKNPPVRSRPPSARKAAPCRAPCLGLLINAVWWIDREIDTASWRPRPAGGRKPSGFRSLCVAGAFLFWAFIFYTLKGKHGFDHLFTAHLLRTILSA